MTDFSHHAQHAVHKATPFVARFARFGYAAKGVVYVLVGGLALWAALGRGGQTTGSRGALQTITDEPFGMLILGLVGIGLACYAAWQFVRAIEDPENEGSDAKAVAKRIGFFISGVVHLGLVMAVAGMITGSATGGQGEDQRVQGWTAWLMSYPFGQWLVAIVGAIIGGYGITQLVKAYKADLDDQLTLSELRPDSRRWVTRICRFGMAARGVVFVLIGIFLIVAAWQQDPDEATGLGGTLQSLQRQPFGPWLLGLVALGLIAYGFYEFIRARYRRIETE